VYSTSILSLEKMADDGRIQKQEEDFTGAVDAALPEALKLATVLLS
jgi:hypothetical protein